MLSKRSTPGCRFSGTIVLDNPSPQQDLQEPKGTIHVEGVVIGDQYKYSDWT